MTFTFETRTCDKCGADWEALDFWASDVPCHDCGRREYEAELEEINSTRGYVVESIGGACPTQAEGTWVDGRRFYFRARHGDWWLYIDAENAVGKWDHDATGDDPSNGWMSTAEVLSILDSHAEATA